MNTELDKCAPPPPAKKPISLSADALFDFDSAVMKPEGHRQVELLAQQWHDAGVEINQLTLSGFTDRFGSAQHNRKLSERRALAVAIALKARGVQAINVDTRGLGAANPVQDFPGQKATPSVIACLAPNRHVEILAK